MRNALHDYNCMKQLVILLTFYFVPELQAQAQKLEYAFTLNELPAVVEGMTYDPKGEHFYFGDDISKRILRYTRDGKPAGYIDGRVYGMTGVAGMRVTTA